jgi:hypothetical protein
LFQSGGGKTLAPGALEDGVSYDEGYMLSPVHELFHGVQYGYVASLPRSLLWIREGTAEAVRHAWAKKTYGGSELAARDYDYPLHQPRVGAGCTKNTEAYDTGHFWYHLGADIGAVDRIAYLRSVLDELSADAGNRGLKAVAKALNPHGGLYDLYPQFIARHADDPEEHFHHPKSVPLSLPSKITDDEAVYAPLKPLTTRAYVVRASVPEGKTGQLRITFENDHPDLHLIVEGERHDLTRSEGDERNVYRTTLSEPDTLLVRVANVAKDPAASQKRPYTLELSLDEVNPCAPQGMIAAMNRDRFVSGLPHPDAVDSEQHMRPGRESTLEISGLVSGGGSACTHHLGALDLAGAMLTGQTGQGAAQDTLKQRGEAIKKQVEQMDLEALRSMSEEALQNMPPQKRQALMSKLKSMTEQAQGLLRPSSKKQEAVVINVYSPHYMTWLAGVAPPPRLTEHGGLAGWGANAAANLVLQLKSATPRDLEEGKTYNAVAHAPSPEASGQKPSVLPTREGFYTRWQGEYRPVPYPPPSTPEEAHRQTREKEACRRAKQKMQQVLQQALQEMSGQGSIIPVSALQRKDCSAKGLAFQGTAEVVAGRLSGTVTMEEITGATVKGRFEVNGTLHTKKYTFTYDEKTDRLSGDRVEEKKRDGPVTLEGTFSAPNHTEGLKRTAGYRSVVIE